MFQTIPVNSPNSNKSYENIINDFYNSGTQTIPRKLMENMTQGDVDLLKYIIRFSKNASRLNLIYYLYHQGFAGKSLKKLIVDESSSDSKMSHIISDIIHDESFCTNKLKEDEKLPYRYL